MKRRDIIKLGVLSIAGAALPVLRPGSDERAENGWVTLFDGKNLDN